MGAKTSYTFNNVQSNHTINATFTLNVYTITATAGANGSISPVGPTTVQPGDSLTYTITPAAGYEVQDVVVDGVSKGAIATYTFTSIAADHTISAAFRVFGLYDHRERGTPRQHIAVRQRVRAGRIRPDLHHHAGNGIPCVGRPC